MRAQSLNDEGRDLRPIKAEQDLFTREMTGLYEVRSTRIREEDKAPSAPADQIDSLSPQSSSGEPT